MRAFLALVALLVLAGVSFSQVPGGIGSCTIIQSAGNYTLTNDISGAPNPYYLGSYTTCIQINASHVHLDCAGHSINTTGDAAVEIEAPGTDVIVQNCVLNNGIGVDVLGMSGGRIVYNRINPSYAGISGVLAFSGFTGSDILYNNITGGSYGIWEPGDSNLIGNNRLISQGSVGLIDAGSGNMITNNYVSGSSGDGMIIDGSSQYVYGNTVTGSAGNGVDDYAYNQTFTYNTISDSGNFGIWAGGEGSGDYTPSFGSISYNTINGSGNTGLEVRGARYMTISNNNIYGNAVGVHLQDSSGEGFHPAVGNVFSNNNVHDNTGDGFNVYGVSSNSFVSNTGSSNGGNGMDVSYSDSILIDPSTFCNNAAEGVLITSSTGINVSYSTACNNGYHGIHFVDTNYSYISGNTAYNNSGDGIALDGGSSNNLVNLNTAYLNTGAANPSTGSDGIYLSGGANNNMVVGNTVYSNVNTGLSVTSSSGNWLIGNTAYSQQNWYGIYLHTASGTYVINNTAHDNANVGFESNGASGDNYTGNSAYSNGASGFRTDSSPTESYYSNNAYGNLGDGFTLNSPSGIAISANNATANGGSGFSLSGGSGDSIASNRAGGNNVSGFVLSSVSGSTLNLNNATNNGLNGFTLNTFSSGNTLTSNIASGNFRFGILLQRAGPGNSLTGNTAYNNNLGISVVQLSAGNSLSSNTAYNNSGTGFAVSNSFNNTLTGNTAYGNGDTGIAVSSGSDNTTLTGNIAHDNALVGFAVALSATNTTMVNNTAYNQPAGDGVFISNSNNTALSNTHLYNNARDLHVLGFGTIYNTTSTYFDNPAGNYQNYTNLSIDDTLNSEYTIRWSAVPSPTPWGPGKYLPFAGKFVNITNLSATSIDKIVWHWNAGELSGYNQVRFELWKNNGAWNLVSDTPDTVNRQFVISNLNSFSAFGILQNNLSTNVSAIKLNQTAALPSPGGIVQFNITVNNSGDLNLNPVKVVDVLPAGLTLLAASPVPDSVAGQTLTWNNLGPLAGNFTRVVYVNATADTGLVSLSTPTVVLSNYANTTGTDKYGNNVTASSIANVTIFYTNVSIVKIDITPVLTSPGGRVQWQINVSNPGQVVLNPVLVTDVLPAGFQFLSSSPNPSMVSLDLRTVIWSNVGPLSPGGSKIILLNSTVNGTVANGTYMNSANVTATPPNGFNVTAEDSTLIGIYAPGISVVKNVLNATPLTGANTTYTINITNTGSINLTLSVVDSLDLNYTFNGSTVTPTSVSNGSIIWTNFTVLPVGASTLITYNITFISPGFYTNNVTVTGAPPNGNSVSDNSSVTTPVYTPALQGGNEPPLSSLSVSVSTNCTSNVVTVTGNGPVEGADVLVDGDSIGSTNSSGQVSFEGCGKSVIIRVSKSGFEDKLVTKALVDCGVCQVQCRSDDQCPATQRCVQNQCVAVECSCGVVQDHACLDYQCCSDSDCGAGMACVQHQCVQRAGCTSDGQCGGDQKCLTPAGAPGTVQSPGQCTNITGKCGYAANHAFIPYNYTCGPEPGCPSCPAGQNCVAHQCLSNDISCPSSGQVGENKTCQLTENNQACSPGQNCTATVVTPDGKRFDVVPDEDGNVQLPLTVQGKYTITLLKNGQVVKQVFVDAIPKAAPTEPEKPGATGPDAFTMLWLLILLAIVVGVVIYWRSRGQKRG